MLSTQISADTNLILQDGNLIADTTQDCDPIADWCTEQVAIGNTGSKDMKLAARIPEIFITAYCNRLNITFQEFLSNKEHCRILLNDPALAKFRIWKGRI
jgi:hypothetical protein